MFPEGSPPIALLAWSGALVQRVRRGPRRRSIRASGPTIFVNFAAGGPTTSSQVVHAIDLAGTWRQPILVVRNMDGAGRMARATIWERSPRATAAIRHFSSCRVALLHPAGERPGCFRYYDFVAYQPGTSIHYMRTDVSRGSATSTSFQCADW